MSANPQHVELTDEQTQLVKRLCKWYRSGTDKQWFAYTGAAGTGKTTVVNQAIEELGISRYLCCAYVGKAVSVLAQHGLPASTIHSMIYDVHWVEQTDSAGEIILRPDGRPKMKVEFTLRDSIRGDPQLLVVDEATMVNDDLCEDILSFGIKTVFIGDNNQLPPVFGVSSIMSMPDFWLTKIMRQSEDNPIVYLSQKVLKRERIPYGTYGQSRVMPYLYLGENYRDYGMILTPKNRVRDDINRHIREHVLGYTAPTPVIGDRLVCRQNDWNRLVDGNLALTTGMVGTVVDIDRSDCGPGYMTIDFHPDIAHGDFLGLRLDARYIQMDYEDRKLYGISSYEKFEYGYATTVHQAQGSQAESVLFNDQWFYDAELTKRVRYTGITRASEKVDIVSEIRFR